jgi:citrate synthase
MSEEVNGQETGVVRGLADVVAANTRLGRVDGKEGRLWYCGYDAIDLAQHARYEEVVYLLLHGELPRAKQLGPFVNELVSWRDMNPASLRFLRTMPGATGPMEALRTMVSALAATDPFPLDRSRDANLRRVVRVVGQMPTLLTAHWRLRLGEEPVPQREDLSHAANLYYMLHGREPTDVEERLLNMCLVLMAEHGLNASTFAVRVVASTLSDVYAAYSAGLGAVNGPLHGAANTESMKMLLDVDGLGDIDAYVEGALCAKRRITGFGHRVYKKADPRATFLRGVLAELDDGLPGAHWYHLAVQVQDAVFKHKQIFPNVDFYAAPALYGLGLPLEMFTAIFACARSAGWGAHMLEQYADNKLIRPASRYVGQPERAYVPLVQRP